MNAPTRVRLRAGRVALLAAATLLLAAGMAWGIGNPVNDDTPYRGSDPYANVAPPTLVEDDDALVNRYPPRAYRLDDDVNPLKDPIASLPHLLASITWELTRIATGLMIALFVWSYHLDVLGAGSGSGALGTVSAAIRELYDSTIGEAWLAAGVVAAGLWGIWKALVQRRYAETAGQLALSVALCVLALFFVLRPAQTVTAIYEPVRQLSQAFLVVPTAADGNGGGSSSDPTGKLADRLHRTLVHEPWVVLEFGGTWHCATPDDGEPRNPSTYTPEGEPVTSDDARCINNDQKYSNRILRASSDDRADELEAIGKGETPDDAPDDYKLGPADRPAYDIQQSEGGFPRLAMSLIVLATNLGAIVLLGSIAAALIISQLLVLFWLVFAPVMLVAAVYPGRGHRLFTGWLQKLTSAMIGIAIYSLILAIVLTLATALSRATPALGWLLAFTLQGIFYWSIVLYRRRIYDLLAQAVTGRDEIPMQRMPILRTIAAGNVATRLASTLTHKPRRPHSSAPFAPSDHQQPAASAMPSTALQPSGNRSAAVSPPQRATSAANPATASTPPSTDAATRPPQRPASRPSDTQQAPGPTQSKQRDPRASRPTRTRTVGGSPNPSTTQGRIEHANRATPPAKSPTAAPKPPASDTGMAS